MVTRADFLDQRYGAYYHSEIPGEDKELTHVGPGTPCGEYLRRFWNPVQASEALKDLPVKLRIMGEELVAFRNGDGEVGLLELHCSHRGTSLEFGLVEKDGIRCCYHGWLFGVDGKILDTPGEPPDSTYKERLCHGSYPTVEYLGLVWAYMGPPEKQPSFPMYDTFNPVPGYCLSKPGIEVWPCNWLQIKDNSMDPFHTAILHTIEMGHGFTEAFKEFGQLNWMEVPNGLIYMHSRRNGDNVWVRITDFIGPNLHQISINTEDSTKEHPPSNAWIIFWTVPVDDTNSVVFKFQFNPGTEASPSKNSFGFAKRPYHETQRVPGDLEAQSSQRTIAVHGLEHLGGTDRGVIMLRNFLRRGIRAVAEGNDLPPMVLSDDGTVITYSSNTVINVPQAESEEHEKLLLLETGKKVAEGLLNGSIERMQTPE
jgi:phenylpropionate dioxygenase-like ring-hydroxylating dioxygenase large terminal subunit